MGKAQDSKTKFDAAQVVHKANPMQRVGRMILCVLSFGMIYPNAFSESVDIADYEARSNTTRK
jgi:hypothetical protein